MTWKKELKKKIKKNPKNIKNKGNFLKIKVQQKNH